MWKSYVQSTRASRADAITHDQAAGLIESWCRFPVQVTTVDVMRAALGTRQRFGISYWDAAILEAGRALGCAVVLSEDLDSATDYDGVRVEDPFRTGNFGSLMPRRSGRAHRAQREGAHERHEAASCDETKHEGHRPEPPGWLTGWRTGGHGDRGDPGHQPGGRWSERARGS